MAKTCFVLMGFGEKTDFRSDRKLNLDKTYKIIQSAVAACGVTCIRADDIIHSGVIDKPMYEHLLEADITIADLSTSNENAIYELGVRHALRPCTTIVIAESQFSFPFDLNHLLIRTYEHLGTGIDFEEADRLKNQLMDAIRTLLDSDEAGSPVYTFLPDLNPPRRGPTALGGRGDSGAGTKGLQAPDAVQALNALPRAKPDQPSDPEEAYWLGATRLEAMLGLGMLSEMEQAKGKLFKTAPESWMRGSTDKQLEKLQLLLEAGAAKTMRQPGMIRQ